MMAPDELIIRDARLSDLPHIVRMLADDHLGQQREQLTDPMPQSYVDAFNAIAADANNVLVVGEVGGKVIATLQLTFTPSISYRGRPRASVESVRTDASVRGQGIGSRMMRFAIERARERNCVAVQLSTHVSRSDAQRFYKRLGFDASHVGMKLLLQ